MSVITRRSASIRCLYAVAPILLVAAGCFTARTYSIGTTGVLSGPSLPSVSTSPTGTETRIEIREGGGERILTGELIAVRGDGFLILSAETSPLMLVPYDRMVAIDFEDDVGANTSVGSATGPWFASIPPLREDAERRRAMARFSRYPFGLDDEQLERLLEAHGQAELVVIGS